MICDKCWADAYIRAMSDTSKTQTEHYQVLLEERKGSPCTSRQQKGVEGGSDYTPRDMTPLEAREK